MIKRLTVISVVCMFVLGLFVGGALAVNLKKEAVQMYDEGFGGAIKAPRAAAIYRAFGASGATCASDVAPQAPITWWRLINLGHTYWDFQRNGSMGRQMCIGLDRYRQFSWTYCAGFDTVGFPRGINTNCGDTTIPSWTGQTIVDGGTQDRYTNVAPLHDGSAILAYTQYRDAPVWMVTLTRDDFQCSGTWSRKWDVPDYIEGISTSNATLGARPPVATVDSSGKDFIHLTPFMINSAAPIQAHIGYERCYFGTSNSMICETRTTAGRVSYTVPVNTYGGVIAGRPIGQIAKGAWTEVQIATSPVSKRVAIVFTPAIDEAQLGYGNDLAFIESMNNGEDLLNQAWPPAYYNTTNYPDRVTTPGNPGEERAFLDLSACYDYQDSLHIAYMCSYIPSTPNQYYPQYAFVKHWSKKAGHGQIQYVEGPNAGYHINQLAASKPSIAAKDPIYHPDSTYLFVTWLQFDSLDQSGSATPYMNGDIFGAGSNDGGYSWGSKWNLTNTQNNGCLPPNCPSEEYQSMALNMLNGNLHIQYLCDKAPGVAMQELGASAQDSVTDNTVYYLEMQEWDIGAVPVLEQPIGIRDVDGHGRKNYYQPPVKVAPGTNKTINIELRNIGNGLLSCSFSSDHSCIIVPGSLNLTPRESTLVGFTLNGTACNDSLIDGTVTISTNEEGKKDYEIPIQAIVSNAYYECPIDPVTYDTLENGVLRMYANVNSGEWIEDLATKPDTTYLPFFLGGSITAMTQGTDTLVGKFQWDMGTNNGNQNAGAREKFYLKSYTDFQVLYTWNIFMHNLNPPAHDYNWWWWEMNKEIVFFKSSASDALKHTVIKYIAVERHDPPTWWPNPTTFAGYDTTYLGMSMDIDCPWDTFLVGTKNESGRNTAGYDSANNIAYQKGYGKVGEHPDYNNYYAGIALARTSAGLVPYGTHNMKNNTFLYPNGGWGWREGELYQLARTKNLGVVDDRDSIVDRSQVFTAKMIPKGTNANAKAAFTIVEAIGPYPGGLTDLQANVAAARAWVDAKPFILCGDVNNDGVGPNLGDVVYLIAYVFKGGPAPQPLMRGDTNGDGIGPNLGDVVYLIAYVFKGGPVPKCSTVW